MTHRIREDTDLRDGQGVNLSNASISWSGCSEPQDWTGDKNVREQTTGPEGSRAGHRPCSTATNPTTRSRSSSWARARRVAFEAPEAGGLKASPGRTLHRQVHAQEIRARVPGLRRNAQLPERRRSFCEQQVQDNVAGIAQQCKLANTCTVHQVSTRPNVDKTSFSAVCNPPTPAAPVARRFLHRSDCDPEKIAKTTAATGEPHARLRGQFSLWARSSSGS